MLPSNSAYTEYRGKHEVDIAAGGKNYTEMVAYKNAPCFSFTACNCQKSASPECLLFVSQS